MTATEWREFKEGLGRLFSPEGLRQNPVPDQPPWDTSIAG